MIRNDTDQIFQLHVWVGEEYLEGEWRATRIPEHCYEILERNPRIEQAAWGGYIRHNELFRLTYDQEGRLLGEEFLLSNDAIMMYSPLLSE